MVHAESAPPCGDAGGRRRWWHPPEGYVSRLLLLLFVELQLADFVSTNAALAMPGVWEANPLMALSQAELGPAWWLPKAAAVILCSITAPLLRRSWPLVFVVAYYAITVEANLAQL